MSGASVLTMDVIRPITASLRNTTCFLCTRPLAAWAVAAPACEVEEAEYLLVCSLCVLYASRLAAPLAATLAQAIDTFERVFEQVLPRNEDGELVSSVAADHILGRLVLEARVAGMLARKTSA